MPEATATKTPPAKDYERSVTFTFLRGEPAETMLRDLGLTTLIEQAKTRLMDNRPANVPSSNCFLPWFSKTHFYLIDISVCYEKDGTHETNFYVLRFERTGEEVDAVTSGLFESFLQCQRHVVPNQSVSEEMMDAPKGTPLPGT